MSEEQKQVDASDIQYEKSASCGALWAALAKAQLEMGDAKKDSQNPFFKSTYADLASVREACWRQLATNEIAVMQFLFTEVKEGHFWAGIRTTFGHSSDQWVAGTLLVPVPRKTQMNHKTGELVAAPIDAQQVSSAHTYGRRITLAAMAGIAPSDDDGNAATAHDSEQYSQVQQAPRQQQRAPSQTEQVKARLARTVGFKPVEAPAAPPQIQDDEYNSIINSEPPEDMAPPMASPPRQQRQLKIQDVPASAQRASPGDFVIDFPPQHAGKKMSELNAKDLNWLAAMKRKNISSGKYVEQNTTQLKAIEEQLNRIGA